MARETAQEKIDGIISVGTSIYREAAERAAMRGGLGDATAICDVLAQAILDENRGYGGKGPPTKRGQELAAVAKRCADAIFAARGTVEVPPSLTPSSGNG